MPGRRELRIANASGFHGDRAAAMSQMLAGGEIDVLTGDYLAEPTMLILARDRLPTSRSSPSSGWTAVRSASRSPRCTTTARP